MANAFELVENTSVPPEPPESLLTDLGVDVTDAKLQTMHVEGVVRATFFMQVLVEAVDGVVLDLPKRWIPLSRRLELAVPVHDVRVAVRIKGQD